MKIITTLLLAITIILTPFLSFGAGNIRDIPFKDPGDTHLSTSFEPIKEDGSTIRNDLTFLEDAVLQILQFMRTILGTLTILFCVYGGYLMVISQGDEGKIKQGKRQLRWGLIALLLIFLAEPFIRKVFFGGGAGVLPGDAIYNIESAKRGVMEIEGFISYSQTFIALIAVYEMVNEGIKMIFSLDKEDSYKNLKKTLIWIGISIFLIFLSKVFVYYGVLGNAITGEERSFIKTVTELSAAAKYLLGFVALVSVATLIYGGFRMITSFGGDGHKEGKNIVVNMAIGVTIIIISYVLVSTIILSNN